MKSIAGHLPQFSRTVLVDDSENVYKVKYDPVSASMLVEFAGGRQYLYRGVAAADFGQLVAAISVGATLNKLIKPKYSYVEVK